VSSNPNRDLSQLDPGGTLKAGFDDERQSHRFYDTEIPVFDRLEVEVDNKDNITKVTYYKAQTKEITQIDALSDVSGSLNNRYFFLSSPFDKVLYYVWYNVDGAGTDPAIANATGIEVNILSNEDSRIVSLATSQQINLIACHSFTAEYHTDYFTIINNQKGPVTATADFNTGFTFTTVEPGREKVNGIFILEYDNKDNITNFYKI